VASATPGVASFERLEAILANPAIYELAELVPHPSIEKGGRRRDLPDFMLFVYEALISVYRSARQVEAELSHPVVWRFIRRKLKKRFPDDLSKRLPRRPMKRHHYTYARNRYLTDPAVAAALGELHRRLACEQARELGLMDPKGPGSLTHPHLSRMLYSDGKVVTPLFRAKAGDTRIDKSTGEIKPVRFEPDADLHFEGDGEIAFGTKFVMVAVRTQDERGRIILDLEWVPDKGGEAKVAMECFDRLAPLVPGAQGVIYDTALRGIHHQCLLRDYGLLPVNKVTAAVAGSKRPRRDEGRRVEKSVLVERRDVALSDGSVKSLSLFAKGGAVGIGEMNDRGEPEFLELKRVKTYRRGKPGQFRWYNDYELPDAYEKQVITVRLHGNKEDAARKFNRTENVRPIAASDPDFKALYRRRNDAESINRGLVDSLYLGRAHSVGHARQLVNLLGYALMVNALALHRHRRRRPGELAAA